MTERTSEETKNERPDPAGIVKRGGAAEKVRGYVEKVGEPLSCFAGGGEIATCEREATMEVWGLPMCSVHGEEAASGAMEEIAYDLDQELGRFQNPHVRPLSPHLEAALNRAGIPSLEGVDLDRVTGLLVEAFPLDLDRACPETVAYYSKNWAERWECGDMPPFDTLLTDRLMVCRHMRQAYEEGAYWLVEALEPHRADVAAQAAYAYALGKEAGI